VYDENNDHTDGEPDATGDLREWSPAPEELKGKVVDEASLLEAQDWISACEHCVGHALIAFNYLLDVVTGCDPTRTRHLMRRTAECPRCGHEVRERTLVVMR